MADKRMNVLEGTWICIFVISSQVLLTCGDPYWKNNENSYDINTAFINHQRRFEHANDPQKGHYYNHNTIKTPHCECVDIRECSVALNVYAGYGGYYERHVVNNFGCGFDNNYPKFCCNLIVENLLIRTHKQKRDHRRNLCFNEHDTRQKNKYMNHFFKWDNNGFPHWNNAPSYPTESWNNYPNWYNHYPTKSSDDCVNETPTKKPKPAKKPTTTTTTTSTTEAIFVFPQDSAENSDAVFPEIMATTLQPIIEDLPVELDLDAATTKEAKRTILTSQTCGIRLQNRIVGGIEAQLRDFPWMARLGYTRNGGNRVLYRCGATLISDRHVVTAAHCVSNLSPGLALVTIRLGELDERTDVDCVGTDCAEPPQDFTPGRVVVHLSYNTPRMSNDIGIVKLSSPVRLSQFVTPLCLPFDGTPEKIINTTGLRAIVAGWGSTNTGITLASPTLQWINLTVIPYEECVLTYRNRYNMTIIESQICTAGIENMDACEGDSGGPLFVAADETRRATLIGIVSFGPRRCGTASLPGVYTRVESFLDWILDSL